MSFRDPPSPPQPNEREQEIAGQLAHEGPWRRVIAQALADYRRELLACDCCKREGYVRCSGHCDNDE